MPCLPCPAVFAAGEEIVMEGTRQKESCLVTAGFAARSQSLRSGERQITAVHVPGDFVDLHSMMLKVMDHSVVALGPCKVAFVPHEKIREATEKNAHLGRMFWLSTTLAWALAIFISRSKIALALASASGVLASFSSAAM